MLCVWEQVRRYLGGVGALVVWLTLAGCSGGGMRARPADSGGSGGSTDGGGDSARDGGQSESGVDSPSIDGQGDGTTDSPSVDGHDEGGADSPSIDGHGEGGVDSPSIDAADAALALGPDTGQMSGLTVTPPSLDFGTVDVRQSGPVSVVTIANAGAPIAVSPTVTGDGFAIVSTTCGAATTSCTIGLKFAPACPGVASGVLTIAPDLTVPLRGVGTVPDWFTVTVSAVPATLLVNQSIPVSVTVTTSQADLSCQASGVDLTPDPLNTTCSQTIAPKTPCVYAYTFTATQPGARSEGIVCSSGGFVKIAPITLSVVTGPELAIAPNPGEFSAVVGSTSAALTFSLTNSGGSATGLLSAKLVGAGADQFAVMDNECAGPLASRSTCTLQVVFKPTTAGPKVATLTVTDDVAGSTPVTVTLFGGESGATLSITGSPSLGSVTVGQTGSTSNYTVTNTSQTATEVLTVTASDAEFAIGRDLCSSISLAPGGTCTFAVTFVPTFAGAKIATLNVSSAETPLAALQIRGTGVGEGRMILAMTPPRLDFGTTSVGSVSSERTFTVINTGGATTGVLAVVKMDSTSSVAGAAQFCYSTTCQAPLGPDGTCHIVVTFAPKVVGNSAATFVVTDGTISTQAGTVIGLAL